MEGKGSTAIQKAVPDTLKSRLVSTKPPKGRYLKGLSQDNLRTEVGLKDQRWARGEHASTARCEFAVG